jgi:hypothetical protein
MFHGDIYASCVLTRKQQIRTAKPEQQTRTAIRETARRKAGAAGRTA